MATHMAIPGANVPEPDRRHTGAEALPGTGGDVASDGPGASRSYPRAAGVMDQVKQTASTRVNEQKARAAEGLGSVANAIRQASGHLRAENQTLASYADSAVDHIEHFADRMRDKDAAQMVRDAERYARRNPAAFVGGAFLLGLGLARFLKSSTADELEGREPMHRDSDFGHPRGSSSTPLSGVMGATVPGGGA